MRRKGGAPRGKLEPYCLPKEQDGAVVRWIPNVQRPPFPYEDEKMDCSVGLNDFVDDRRQAYLSKQLQMDMCYGCLTPTKGGNRAKTFVTICAYCWFPLCWTCQHAGKTSVGNDCCGICYFDSVSLQRKKTMRKKYREADQRDTCAPAPEAESGSADHVEGGKPAAEALSLAADQLDSCAPAAEAASRSLGLLYAWVTPYQKWGHPT